MADHKNSYHTICDHHRLIRKIREKKCDLKNFFMIIKINYVISRLNLLIFKNYLFFEVFGVTEMLHYVAF